VDFRFSLACLSSSAGFARRKYLQPLPGKIVFGKIHKERAVKHEQAQGQRAWVIDSDAGNASGQKHVAENIGQAFGKLAFTIGSELIIDGGMSNL
jgi:hypothetical protein